MEESPQRGVQNVTLTKYFLKEKIKSATQIFKNTLIRFIYFSCRF